MEFLLFSYKRICTEDFGIRVVKFFYFYNCTVLFLTQVNYLFNYAPKTKNSTEIKKFLIDFNVKTLKCIF